jgi:hypothetical protein
VIAIVDAISEQDERWPDLLPTEIGVPLGDVFRPLAN